MNAQGRGEEGVEIPLPFFSSISCSVSVFVALSRGSCKKKKREKKRKSQIWPLSTVPAESPASAYFQVFQRAETEEQGGSDFCCEANWLMHSKISGFDFVIIGTKI